jgi:hypothetical protein
MGGKRPFHTVAVLSGWAGQIVLGSGATFAVPIATDVECWLGKAGQAIHADDPHHDPAENRAPAGRDPGGRRGRLQPTHGHGRGWHATL